MSYGHHRFAGNYESRFAVLADRKSEVAKSTSGEPSRAPLMQIPSSEEQTNLELCSTKNPSYTQNTVSEAATAPT
jgi:hypothetical protein